MDTNSINGPYSVVRVSRDSHANQARRDIHANQAWMITFTDLVSLMLTFFIMLFSMSNVKLNSWEKMIDALSQDFRPSNSTAFIQATAKHNISTTFKRRAINLDYLSAVLEEALDNDVLTRQIRIVRQQDRLIIVLNGAQWFLSGQAGLTEGALRALFNLGGVLRNVGNEISINGYAGPRRSTDGAYESAYGSVWELSLARAVSVGNALRQAGYADKLATYGYSGSRVSGIAEISVTQRRALTRRVDIVIKPNIGDN